MPEGTRISLVNLGCSKNTVDSEHALGLLADRGAVIAAEPADAEIVLVNTCGFIDAAKSEAIETLLDLADLKNHTDVRAVVAMGCLVQRYGPELAKAMPEIDGWIPFGAYDRLDLLLDRLLADDAVVRPPRRGGIACGGRFLAAPRLRLGPQHTAYLKIAEGCSHRCAFCAIPQIRGPLESRPHDYLVDQARALVDGGARELIVIAQDTTAYGRDRKQKQGLPRLIEDLLRIDDLRWLRLLYAHPAHLTDEVIDLLVGEPRVCRYLDLPIQHVDTGVLKRMRRGTTGPRLLEMLNRIREKDPDLALRSTLITGFPGETEAAFERLLEVVESGIFTHLGVFAYSEEDRTEAAKAPDQVPEDVRQARRDALMEAQQQVAFARADAWTGRQVELIVDEPVLGADMFVARSEFEAPDVDPVVFLDPGSLNVRPGQFVHSRIVGRQDYDLEATALEVAAEAPTDAGRPMEV